VHKVCSSRQQRALAAPKRPLLFEAVSRLFIALHRSAGLATASPNPGAEGEPGASAGPALLRREARCGAVQEQPSAVASPASGRSGAASPYRHQPKPTRPPPQGERGAARAESSCMDKPRYSRQPACADNPGQLQPNAQPERLPSLQGEGRVWGKEGKRGIPPPARPASPAVLPSPSEASREARCPLPGRELCPAAPLRLLVG